MARTDPNFAAEIKKYGAKDFSACYSCGNCTAVCGLTSQDANFPRMMIRYGMLGLKEEILASKELWLCYACGECTETCPRQAAPGDYMAALRRYAIASYEPTGLTRMMFRSNPFFIGFTLFLAVILGMFLFSIKPETEVARWIFYYIPYEVIHAMGLVIFSITGLSMAWGVVTMFWHLKKGIVPGAAKPVKVAESLTSLGKEVAGMKRYDTCDEEETDYHWNGKSFLIRPRFVHLSIMWGFIGLFLATVLDFMLKDPATAMWWPSRLLGTVAGLFLVYGTSLAIGYRLKKVTTAYASTRLADWVFLWFLWIAGVTGFWLEISVAFSADVLLNHFILLVHTIISMELVLLFAFSKFAHAVYRPMALYFHYRKA